MYLSKHKHLLSRALMATAALNLLSAGINGVVRLIIGRTQTLTPDMADSLSWNAQLIVSALQLILTCVIFHIAWKRLSRYMHVVSRDDREEMGRLQEEVFGKKISSLSADAIRRLLQIWAVILVGTQFVYDITSIVYRRFIMQLFGVVFLSGTMVEGMFESLYSSTHGFKYLGMLIAIFLGVMMTGIFLNDTVLKISTGVLTLLFLASFALAQMGTISLFGHSIGVVWTSVIFHLTDTVGLLGFAVYLRKHYLGV